MFTINIYVHQSPSRAVTLRTMETVTRNEVLIWSSVRCHGAIKTCLAVHDPLVDILRPIANPECLFLLGNTGIITRRVFAATIYTSSGIRLSRCVRTKSIRSRRDTTDIELANGDPAPHIIELVMVSGNESEDGRESGR